jgi:undecaprenyl-diphosphatase
MPEEPAGTERKPLAGGLWLFALILLFGIVHLALAASYPLSEDEAYYWEWSRRLDVGYYDQGPMIAWWMRAFCALLGETVLGIRLGAAVASAALMAVGCATAARVFGPRAAIWSVAALSVTPLAMAGGFIFTYDILQVLFWALAIHALILARERPAWWLPAGVWLGLGLLSKLTMALFVPCALLYLLTTPERRRELRTPWPWLAALIGLLIFAPNLLWQAEHRWATFDHMRNLSQASQGKDALGRVGDLLGAQAALLSPILFLLCIVALVWSARSAVRHRLPGAWMLWCFSAPVLLFFLATAIRGKVLGNWPAVGWYGATLLLPAWAGLSDMAAQPRPRAASWLLPIGMASSLLLSALAVLPELPDALGFRIPADIRRQSDKMLGGPELAAAIMAAKAELEAELGEPVRVAANQYQEASRAAFHLPGQPYVYCFFVAIRKNQFLFWNEGRHPLPGESFVLVLDVQMRDNMRPVFERLFERIVEPPTYLPIRRYESDRRPAHTYFIYKLVRYRSSEPPPVG